MIEMGLVIRDPTTEMWGRLWRIDPHWDRGELAVIDIELPRPKWCVDWVRRPFAASHVLAALAQARPGSMMR